MTTENKEQLNRQLYSAVEVTPSKRFWTVLVQVLEKHITKEAVNNRAMKYKNYVLVDMEGTKIPAVTFNQSNAHVAKILLPFGRYYVSNATVDVCEPRYRLGDYEYKWILSNRTLIEPIHDDVPHTIPCPLNLTNFSEFIKLADCDVAIDVKALVIHSYAVHSASNSKVREYILVDEMKKPLILRLWDEYLDNDDVHVSARLPNPTLIIGKNLKVTTHNGLSLTTKATPYFMIDPPLGTPEPLLRWYEDNVEAVSEMISNKSYLDTEVLFPPPRESDILHLHEVLSSIDVIKTSWVSATLHMVPAQESIWYTFCQNCNKYINGKIGWEINCTCCGEKSLVVPRCRMDVFLNDATTTICATAYGRDVEKLTGMSAKQMHIEHEKDASLLDRIEKKVFKKEIVCFIKYFEKTYGGKAEKKYPIIQLYTVDELSHKLPTRDAEPTPLEIAMTSGENSPLRNRKEKEFFTPTTKKVIDEIDMSTKVANAKRLTVPLEAPKKKLFLDVEAPASAGSPVGNNTLDDAGSLASATVRESPTKRMKNREQIKLKKN